MSAMPVANQWEVRRLRDAVTKLVDGSHNPPPKQERGMPMLSARNIENNRIVFDAFRFITDESFATEHARTRVSEDDVLLTIVGTIGRCAVVPKGTQPFALQRSVAVLSPKHDVLSKFLNYQLQSPAIQRYFESKARGTAQKGVYLKTLGETPVGLPSLDDQRAVVAEIEKQFSRLDEAVANLKRVKANLNRYKAAVLKAAVEGRLVPTEAELARKGGRNYETGEQLLQRILESRRKEWSGKGKYKEPSSPDDGGLGELPDGWVWGCLDQVVSRIEAGASFKCIERPPTDGETGVLKVSAVSWGEFDEMESKTCADAARLQDGLLVKKGDFLFSRANTIELVGACVIVNVITKRLMLSDKTLRLRISALIPQHWVLVLLRSRFGRNEVERLATGNQESMRNIGQERIRQIRLPIPSIAELNRILMEVERRLSMIRNAEAQAEVNLRRAERMRLAILAASFNQWPVREKI